MLYRRFGPLDWQVSALGFGCMRFPVVDGERGSIDVAEATRMLHRAIDRGVNYLDTGYNYHDGQSEVLLGQALQGAYRDKVRVATKMPCWLVKERADLSRFFSEQLERLRADHVDVYLLHALNRDTWRTLYELGVLDWADKQIEAGRIGCFGFSFHDRFSIFRQIVDAYDNWTLCQIQYNYVDIHEQAGQRGLAYAAQWGLAVVVMEPLRGGRLVNPPPQIQAIWDRAPVQRTPADWALQWLWNQPEVSVVLSGMSTMEQVKQNLASASDSGAGQLTGEEQQVIAQAMEAYQGLWPIPCTQCEYCLPCPNGVDIPGVFSLVNHAAMYGELERARQWYAAGEEQERASACVQCGDCESRCPQQIEISRWMPLVHKVLGEGQSLDVCRLA